MVKITFGLPIRGGRGKADEPQDQRLTPNLHEEDLPDYGKFPYSTLFPADAEAPKDLPVLDKSTPEYRERLQQTLNALQDEYQKTYQEYKEANRRILAYEEGKEQRLLNLAVLDPRYVVGTIDSLDPVREDELRDLLLREWGELRKCNYDCPYYMPTYLAQNLYRIEVVLGAGLRELARLDGTDSDETFRQLRGAWARRISDEVDDWDFLDLSIVGESANVIND